MKLSKYRQRTHEVKNKVELTSDLIKELKFKIFSLDLKQKDVAYDMGIEAPHLCMILKGDIKNLRHQTIDRIKKVLAKINSEEKNE